jgi:tRNA-dihydrouridine synthase 1
MVDQSEEAFRLLCREFGTTLAYTPMLHSRMMIESEGYMATNFTSSSTDRPVIAQFCGNDPDILLRAARMVEDAVDAVDINLGCPQGIARRGHYGSFLLEETDLLVRMVSALHTGLKVPVTCKVRVLPTWEATLNLVKALEGAGCSLLTVHGRTRTNMKQSITAVDWDIIKRIKQHVSIPVVANGGVGCFEDVEACLRYTGCDAVMTSEALLENPGLLSDNIPTSGPLYEQAVRMGVPPPRVNQLELALRYLDLAERCKTEWGIVKAHVFKMLFGVWRCFPEIRARLNFGMHDIQAMREAVMEAQARYRAEILPQIVDVGSDIASSSHSASATATLSTGAADMPASTSANDFMRYKRTRPVTLDELSEQWRAARSADPPVGWSKPQYLLDPAVGGSWYMRYRPEAYGGATAPEVIDGTFTLHLEGALNAQAGEGEDPLSLPLEERLRRFKEQQHLRGRPCGCVPLEDQVNISGFFSANDDEL